MAIASVIKAACHKDFQYLCNISFRSSLTVGLAKALLPYRMLATDRIW